MSNALPTRLECIWCGDPFEPRKDGGRTQRYCSPKCRRAIDAARRRYVGEALACGELTIARLKAGAATTRALPRCPQSSDSEPVDDPALLPMLRVRGSMVLRPSITPEGIAALVRLRWLSRRSCYDAVAVSDAIVELASAAIDLGLRPSR